MAWVRVVHWIHMRTFKNKKKPSLGPIVRNSSVTGLGYSLGTRVILKLSRWL